jgi:hypothetical protein
MKIFNYQHSDSFDRYASVILKTAGVSEVLLKQVMEVAEKKGLSGVDEIAEIAGKILGREATEEVVQQTAKQVAKNIIESAGSKGLLDSFDNAVKVQADVYLNIGKVSDEVINAKTLGLSEDEIVGRLKEIDSLKGKLNKLEEGKKKLLKTVRDLRAKGKAGAEQVAEMEKKLVDSDTAMVQKNKELMGKMNQIDALKKELIGASKKYTDSLEARLSDAVKSNKISSDMYERIIALERELGEARGWRKALESGKAAGDAESKALLTRLDNVEKKLVSESNAIAKEVEQTAGKEVSSSIGKATSESAKESFNKVVKAVGDKAPAAKEMAKKFISKKLTGKAGTLFKWTSRLVKVAALYILYKHFTGKSTQSETYKKSLADTKNALLRLKFNPGSNGDNRTKELIKKIDLVLTSIDAIGTGGDISEEDFKTKYYKETLIITKHMDELSSAASLYILDADTIKVDLQSNDGWDEAIASLNKLVNSNNEFGSSFPVSAEQETFVAPKGEQVTPDEEPERGRKPVNVEVYGTKVDISSEGPAFRSSAPRIISRVLNTPAVLRFLFKKQIDSEGKLKGYMRNVLTKSGGKRLSGWKGAINYYRKNPYRPKVEKEVATKAKAASKMQKNNDLYNFNDFSINKEFIPLNKMADMKIKS